MKTYEVAVERVINASTQRTYNVIVDMEEHRRILPRQFESLEVLHGGKGAGTVIRLTMNVLGNRSTLNLTLSEPEPGRIVEERDEQAGVTTTWEVTPVDGGRCRIRLTSKFSVKPGLAGVMERLLVPPVIRSFYRQELDNIDRYVAAHPQPLRPGA